MTQERVLEREDISKIEFFIVDEFYKLDSTKEAGDRNVALNQALYKLLKHAKQFYLLGPNISGVPEGFKDRYSCSLHVTDYKTVVSEIEIIPLSDTDKDGKNSALEKILARHTDDATTIYCKSPASVKDLTKYLLENNVNAATDTNLEYILDWLRDQYHPQWIFIKALEKGIGLHHGRIPRALQQLVVRLYNEGKIRLLLCTSTLIEGVNTTARNIVIYDNKLFRKNLDFFTFNNIRGRSGRMFEHFIGNVYVFTPPPAQDSLQIDIPMFTQNENAPLNLLMLMEEHDLKPKSLERLSIMRGQDLLPENLLKENAFISPDKQIEAAKIISERARTYHEKLCWHGKPTHTQLEDTTEFMSDYLFAPGIYRESVLTANQLVYWLENFRRANSIDDFIKSNLRHSYTQTGQYKKSEGEVIEDCLFFIRHWATFHYPRYLSALQKIFNQVMMKNGMATAEYSHFASSIEYLFTDNAIAALDEYGLPIQIGSKISLEIDAEGKLDETIERLKRLNAEQLPFLDQFEKETIQYVQESL